MDKEKKERKEHITNKAHIKQKLTSIYNLIGDGMGKTGKISPPTNEREQNQTDFLEKERDNIEEEPEAKRQRSGSMSAVMRNPEEMRILSLVLRGCDVFELFSPERVGKVCSKYDLVAGPALDLRTGWARIDSSDY